MRGPALCLFPAPSGDAGRAPRQVAETRLRGCVVCTLGLASDNWLIGNGLVRVPCHGTRDCRITAGDVQSRPAIMDTCFDLEPEAKIAISRALPGAVAGSLRATPVALTREAGGMLHRYPPNSLGQD